MLKILDMSFRLNGISRIKPDKYEFILLDGIYFVFPDPKFYSLELFCKTILNANGAEYIITNYNEAFIVFNKELRHTIIDARVIDNELMRYILISSSPVVTIGLTSHIFTDRVIVLDEKILAPHLSGLPYPGETGKAVKRVFFSIFFVVLFATGVYFLHNYITEQINVMQNKNKLLATKRTTLSILAKNIEENKSLAEISTNVNSQQPPIQSFSAVDNYNNHIQKKEQVTGVFINNGGIVWK